MNTSPDRKREMRPKGFTLTEMLIVMAIVVALMALLLPAVSRVRRRAVTRKTENFCKQIESAWKSYHTQYRKWPDADVRHVDLPTMRILAGRDSFHNPRNTVFMEFMDEEWNPGETETTGLRDPWGNLYRVAIDNGRGWDAGNPANNVLINISGVGTFERRTAAWSSGPDGQDGTADDIRSWE